jgi:hypothetical protein
MTPMITIKSADNAWAIYGGFNWEVQNDYSETVTYFHTWDEVVDHLSTLNY